MNAKKDFFISYTEVDKNWATWIAGVLEADGHTTYLQAWDFKPGENFVLNMHNALKYCEKFIAVLSPKYMEKVYCQAEWTAAFTKDPSGEKALFIPIRIEDFKPDGLLAPIIYIDLFGVDEEEAKERMKKVVEGGRPRNMPGFPGTKRLRFPGQLPFNNIPYNKNLHFTGRKEILDDLEKSFKPGKDNPYSIALCGMGAVGKTQIVLAYAINNGYLYDTIWWVNAENELSLLNSYKDFLLQKEIIKKDVSYERTDILQSVWAWMSQHPNWLFIYDNAESENELTHYLPRSNTGHILITTRNSNWRNTEKISVEEFRPDEAVDFLKSFKLEGSIDDAERLAEELGCLPLALDQAAAYMLETNKSYQEYFELFKNNQLRMFGEVEYESTSYERTVATTWNISLDKIENESAKQLIQLISFLAADLINMNIFLQNSEDLPVALASAVRNELVFEKTIKDLTRYSLIRTYKERISIHHLLQAVIRQSLGKEKVLYFEKCVRILDKLFIYDEQDVKTWGKCASLISHVHSVLMHEEELKSEIGEVSSLYSKGARWLEHSVLYEKAVEWNEKAIAIQEQILGPDHPDTAMLYHNIAFVYGKQGEYNKALEWFNKALTITSEHLGPNHQDMAWIYNNIAIIFREKGEYDKAMEWHQKALAIFEKLLGPDHPDTATSYNNIAVIYANRQEFDKALEWHKKALAIQGKVPSPDHPITAAMYNNIAFVYGMQGKYKKALKWYEKAMVIYRKVLGPDHPNTATLYNNIAGIHVSQGKFYKALEWLEKALAIQEKVLGADHPHTATSYHNIAGICIEHRKYKEALEWEKKAMAIREKVLGNSHLDTATSYNNMAIIYSRQGDYDKAKVWYEKALAIREKSLESDNTDFVKN